MATKNHAVALSIPPLPTVMGRRTRRKIQKFVGWDENNLTEWHRVKDNNNDKKNIQRAMFSPLSTYIAP